MKRARICSILAIFMVLCMVSGSAAVLRDQEEYTPSGSLEEINTDRSQVYVDGEGYFVDSEQKTVHEEAEQARQEQIQQNPIRVNPTVPTVPRQTYTYTPPRRPTTTYTPRTTIRKPYTPPKKTTKKTKKKKKKETTEPKKEETTTPVEKPETPPEEETPAEQKEPPAIESSLENGFETEESSLEFWVTVKDADGEVLPAGSSKNGHFTVTCNGTELSSTGTSGKKTSFTADLKSGRNIILISAEDKEGRTSAAAYWLGTPLSEEEKTEGTVTVSIEAPVLNLGTIHTAEAEILTGDPAGNVLQAVFDAAGITPVYTDGTLTGFEMSGIAEGASISDEVKEYLKSIGKTEKDSSGQDKDSLKNEDFYDSSGWAFILNGVVMDMDLAAFPMEDGDTLQIVFKLADGVF